MGNTESVRQIIDRSDDEYNYNIDAEVVSKDDMATVPNISTPLDIKYNKMYIIYQRVNGASRTFVLSIKILDDNIFVYVTDIFNEKTILAHVAKILGRSDKSVSYYLKYIQVSRDFTLLSLPENDRVNVYNLTKLLNRNILEYVDNVGIVLKADAKGEIRSGIEVFSSMNKAMNLDALTDDLARDRLGKIDFKHIDCNIQPYKCVLCKDLYIVVCADYNRYKRICAIDYKNKIMHEVNNLDLDVNRSALRFSTNGRFIAIYDGAKNQLFICDMSDKDPKPKQVSLVIKSDTVLDTVCISEDGRFFFYIEDEDMKFRVYDVYFMKTYILDSGLKLERSHIKDIKFHLMDYSRFSDIALSGDACDNLYVLVGWSKRLSAAFYWMIRCSETGYNIYGPSFVDMKIEGKIEYVYNNGYMFIYKTPSGITVYDLNKVIPIRFAGMLASGSKNGLTELFKEYYGTLSYYDSIELVGADDSRITYPVTPYMQFLMSLIKPTASGIDTNVFQLRVTSNIDIYGATKSFNIFQDLLTGKINQSDVIENIFAVQGAAGRHNMMADLMNHMYEYTRVIALKETSAGDLNRSGFSRMKSLYIGYILIVLVLKYYSMMLKSFSGASLSGISVTKNVGQKIVIKENIEKHLNFDIIETFNKNFPAFKGFVERSMDILMGEKL